MRHVDIRKRKELLIRRTLYIVLLVIAPAFVFIGQAVIFMPALSILSKTAWMGWLMLTAQDIEPIVTLVYAGHFVLFAALYWLLALALGKAVMFFHKGNARVLMVVLILFVLLAVSQMSLYGSGGHGPGKLGPIQSLVTQNPIKFD